MTRKHTEYQHQCTVIQWRAIQKNRWPEYGYLFAIDNGGFALTPAAAARRKRQGCRAGVPDLFWPLVIPGSRAGLWVEMKAPDQRQAKNGGLSDAQIGFRVHLTAEGYEHYVCYDSQEAIAVIRDYHRRWREARRLDVPRLTNRSGQESVRIGA